ncbi:hypothetical protein [Mesorhizobium retamae]|uniref:Uncharacterized protein n=1 Tax=Mesorhizobium retamae TaxID=2912854 RepID=A0ABS9QI07_9HYPH|nr:hypothetical protein [Mesorhizobium sp. IRAMC:0171]MCG7507046.1 hypothetical protein [Mesorhizobium sp. IRAMC:0171]
MPTKPNKGEVKKTPCGPLVLVAYVVAGFLTFGHVFNRSYEPPTSVVDCGEVPDILSSEWDKYWVCRQDNIRAKYSGGSFVQSALPAMAAGLIWPIYWGGVAAIKVTK